MIKKYLLALIIALQAFIVGAQSQQTMALGNSTNLAEGIAEGDMAMYEGAALAGIRETNLCIMLERKEWEKILREKGINKTDDFLNGKIPEQGVALGADYLLLITIQSLNISENKKPYSNTYTNIFSKNKEQITEQGWEREISCSVIIGAKVVAITNGIVKHNETFTLSSSETSRDKGGYFGSSKEEVAAAMKSGLAAQCSSKFGNFAYDIFPPVISVIKVEEVKPGKKEKAKQVLCATSSKLVPGSKMEVCQEEILTVGAEKMVRRKRIGELRVVHMDGDKIVLCDVTDGSEEILQKMREQSSLKCTLLSVGAESAISFPKIPKIKFNNLIGN